MAEKEIKVRDIGPTVIDSVRFIYDNWMSVSNRLYTHAQRARQTGRGENDGQWLYPRPEISPREVATSSSCRGRTWTEIRARSVTVDLSEYEGVTEEAEIG